MASGDDRIRAELRNARKAREKAQTELDAASADLKVWLREAKKAHSDLTFAEACELAGISRTAAYKMLPDLNRQVPREKPRS